MLPAPAEINRAANPASIGSPTPYLYALTVLDPSLSRLAGTYVHFVSTRTFFGALK